jgi:type I restriction enzyme S subunit
MLVDRLEEKRIALISCTVTRGLPPAAPAPPVSTRTQARSGSTGSLCRSTGNPRLGFYLAHITVGAARRENAAAKEYRVWSLNARPARWTEIWFTSRLSPRILSCRCKKGFAGAAPGTPRSDRFDGANCIDLIIVRKPRKGVPSFFSYFLNSMPAQAQFTGGAGGAIQQHFNIAMASDLWLLDPPDEEQSAIAKFLDHETAKIDAMVAKVETAIERLQEYRTALITAAVTGKIDVRGGDTVAALPRPQRPQRVDAHA